MNIIDPFLIDSAFGMLTNRTGPMNKVENGAKPTSEGASPMVEIVNGERDSEHGGFLHVDGQYPW